MKNLYKILISASLIFALISVGFGMSGPPKKASPQITVQQEASLSLFVPCQFNQETEIVLFQKSEQKDFYLRSVPVVVYPMEKESLRPPEISTRIKIEPQGKRQRLTAFRQPVPRCRSSDLSAT